MLTLYRRHVKACPHRSRNYKRCQCPIWAQGTLGNESVRQALDLTSWDAVEDEIYEWRQSGKIGKKRKTVKEALTHLALKRSDCAAT